MRPVEKAAPVPAPLNLHPFRRWGFTARYLWLLIRHGYEAHPMEIEAREISGHR